MCGRPNLTVPQPVRAPSYEEHAPCPALRNHVACYWTLDGVLESDRLVSTRTPSAPPGGHRVLPDGCMDLLMDLAGGASLVGTMTTAIVAPTTPRTRFFGVRFRPGEAFAFVGVPGVDVRDAVLPLRDAWGSLADRLADRVASAPDTAARVAAVDRELLGVLARTRPADARVRRAVMQILGSPAEARVAWLARDVGVGERQLERAFGERVGIGPKAFARVARLQMLVERLAHTAPGAAPQWAALAADVGYADQPHLVREVKRLAGITPTELARVYAMTDSFNTEPAARDTTGA